MKEVKGEARKELWRGWRGKGGRGNFRTGRLCLYQVKKDLLW
jgi:hypothetical protein